MAVRKKAENYVTKIELLEQIEISKKQYAIRLKDDPGVSPAECMTPELIRMIMLSVSKYASKGNWRSYTYNEDMQGDAIISLMNGSLKFKPEVSQNPFGYITQIVTHSFLTTLEKEKKMRNIRDDILEQNGYIPSNTRQLENDTTMLSKRQRSFYGDGTDTVNTERYQINFPPHLESWNPILNAAIFMAIMKDKLAVRVSKFKKPKDLRIKCIVSQKIIETHLSGHGVPDNYMTAISLNRGRLHNAAHILINDNKFKDATTIKITVKALKDKKLDC